jgi:hypothetical protein
LMFLFHKIVLEFFLPKELSAWRYEFDSMVFGVSLAINIRFFLYCMCNLCVQILEYMNLTLFMCICFYMFFTQSMLYVVEVMPLCLTIPVFHL